MGQPGHEPTLSKEMSFEKTYQACEVACCIVRLPCLPMAFLQG